MHLSPGNHKKSCREGTPLSFVKRLQLSTLCALALGFALSACSSSRKHKTTALPQTNHNEKSASILVYPQKAPVLELQIHPAKITFTPLRNGEYNERLATFSVRVSGIRNADDADSLRLDIATKETLEWFSWHVESSHFSEGTQTFVVRAQYLGVMFYEPPTLLHLNLETIPQAYAYSGGKTLHVATANGWDTTRSIPLLQTNMTHFNHYANTPEGLKRHYQLMENVVLPPGQNNWTAIGRYVAGVEDNPFAGSFDGGGHSISNLSLSSDKDLQGMFGIINAEAVVKNLGLKNVSVHAYNSGSNNGNVVGGLVGGNNGGRVQNCYVSGTVTGNSIVGGLVGANWDGLVHNSYATSNVTSKGLYAGGLVGRNEGGLLQDSYATGKVEGLGFVGGLVGLSTAENGMVRSCYATGSVTGTGKFGYVGGLLGKNGGGRVRNCAALNPLVVSGGLATTLGRVAGNNEGSLSGNYARNMKIRYGVNPGTVKSALANHHNGVDGADVSAGEYGHVPFWTHKLRSWEAEAQHYTAWDFSESGAWLWGPYRLPILKNIGGEQNHTAK